MSINQYRLMLIPLLATFIMAGFVTTVGLLTEPAAEAYAVSITEIAAQFTWFTGGVFVGGILAFFLFDYFSIRSVVIGSYLIAILLVGVLHLTRLYLLLSALLAVIGALLAIAGCAGVTLITQQWQGRRRQMIMVAQDIMFNGGGILFASVVIWFLLREFAWTSTYLAVAVLMSVVMLLAFSSNFEPVVQEDRVDEDPLGEWNIGILLVGFSLLLFMMAKIAIFVWAPQFIQQTFQTGPEAGGEFMGNVFLAAFAGSLIGTWVASRVDVKFLLYFFVLVSLGSVLALTYANDLSVALLLAYGYGVSVSATYNSYVAFGLSFVKCPNHKNVVYLQLMSGLGSTLAPFISSIIVDRTGDVIAAMQFCFLTLLMVAVTMGVCHLLHSRINVSQLD